MVESESVVSEDFMDVRWGVEAVIEEEIDDRLRSTLVLLKGEGRCGAS